MQVTRNDGLAAEMLKKMADAQRGEDRTFQHPSVSDLIGCLTKSFLNLYSPVEESSQTNIYYLIGLGVEKALIGHLQNKKASGEYDGVFYHLDSLEAGDSVGRWFELKTTRISPSPTKNRPEGGVIGYLSPGHGFGLRQILSYSKTQNLTELDLGILYLIQAQFDVWRISFTQEEIDTHWEWMQIRRDVFNEAVEKQVAPTQYMWNEEWECKNCQYSLLCEMRQRFQDNKDREEINNG